MMISMSFAKRAIFVSVVAILALTVLEFPPPIGFETRPQSDVSSSWLVLFLVILAIEIATVRIIYKGQRRIGGTLGILAATLNVIQIFADQMHLIQPEIAPLAYSSLEYAVGLFSMFLAYFSWRLFRSERAMEILEIHTSGQVASPTSL